MYVLMDVAHNGEALKGIAPSIKDFAALSVLGSGRFGTVSDSPRASFITDENRSRWSVRDSMGICMQ